MATSNIRVLALDLDGTLTNDQKEITPRTRAALERAMDQGVTVVLASGRPTAGVRPVAQELGLDQRGGCILSYNGGAIVDCKTGEIRYQKLLPAELVPELCAFAAQEDVAIVTYNDAGIVTERPEDPWAAKESFTNKLPMIRVEDLAVHVDYPVNKMPLPWTRPGWTTSAAPPGRSSRAGSTSTPPAPSSWRRCPWGWPRTPAWRRCFPPWV